MQTRICSIAMAVVAAVLPNRAFSQGVFIVNNSTSYNCGEGIGLVCIDDVTAFSDTPDYSAGVIVHWFGGFTGTNFYNFRYALPGSSAETQVKVDAQHRDSGNPDGSFTVPIGTDLTDPYTFKVQSCVNNALAPATCTGWFTVQYSLTLKTVQPSQPAGLTTPTPGTCKAGYVWRQANARDHVCVTAQTRQQVADDNAAASKHGYLPDLIKHMPGACYPGYVWRQAYAADYVCVTPQTRDQAASDNAAAASHTN